jgi:hypothetical protein
MKTIKKLMFSILLLNLTYYAAAQNEWVRVFGEDESYAVRGLTETYDGGYIIGGHSKNTSGALKQGFIIKTDINGEMLWQKTIGELSDNGVDGTQVQQTFDGGYILFSGTYKYGSRNVMLMKLNACGEKQWNKVFISSDLPQFNYSVLQMPDSTYLIQLAYWGNDLANKRIWLFKIGTNGEILWKKVQAQWTTGTNAEEGYQTIKNNNEYLISGQYYQWEPGYDTNARWVRPMFIKVDSNGNEIWHRLWGVGEFYVGGAIEAVFNSNNFIYGVGTDEADEEWGDDPSLFKLDPNGNQVFQKDLIEANGGGASTINILEDSILFISATIRDWNDSVNLMVLKTDTNGTILNSQEFLLDIDNGAITSSLVTHDGKFLATGNFYFNDSWDVYLWKFNRNLEYDSIYTQPRVYDSLCPYPIVSDTISIDTTIVNLDELYDEMTGMTIRPNPANNKLYFTLGEMVTATEIRLYNTSGIKVKTLKVHPSQLDYELDISSLPSGLYVAILLNRGRILEKEKIVISR